MNALADGTNSEVFVQNGIELDAKGELLVDSAHPRAIPLRAFNPLTGEFKNYMLRVTSKGGLCLV
jgi:hypothetical protein